MSLVELREAVQDPDGWRKLILQITRSRLRLDEHEDILKDFTIIIASLQSLRASLKCHRTKMCDSGRWLNFYMNFEQSFY